MADRHDTSPSVGQALRDMALRSGSAFPDFNTVFDSERIERRRGRMVLAFGAILVLVCAAAFLGWPAIFPANPLIESWDEPSAEARLGMAGASRSRGPSGYFPAPARSRPGPRPSRPPAR